MESSDKYGNESRTSFDRFQIFFNNLQDAFFQVDRFGMLVLVNPSAVRMFGYNSSEEMTGRPVVEFYANQEERMKMLAELRSKKQLVDYIVLAKKKDGSKFWISMNVQYIYINGELEGSESIIRDISKRKTDEEQIQTFSSILEQSPVSIVITDVQGNIEYVNPKFEKTTGYSLEEAMGKNPRILKSDTKTNEEYQEMWNSITSGKEWHGEFLNVKKNGELYYESASISPVRDENGHIIRYIAVKEDITERKKYEEQIKTLSTVVEQSPLMIIITDRSGKIEYVNAEFSRFTQYSSREIIGRIPMIFNQKHHTAWSHSKMWETLQEGKLWLSEFKNRKKDGTIFWENITAFPLTSEDGLIMNYIIINEDITDKKQLLDDLVKSKEKAEESDRLKSAFLANMSHEIRTPMNGILGFTELLKEPNLSGAEQQFYIKIITESGHRMLNLMNNLIDISRIESHEVKIICSSFDIRKKFDHLLDFFNQEAKMKGLRLICTCDLMPHESLIETDVQKLDSVLENLVKNAIKFTKEGTIEFGCEKQESHYRFFVKDSGAGIDPAHQSIIFDRFRQASESLSRPYEGAGLGLSISKAYVEILGGKIWVESEPGKGAVFYFTLPKQKVNPPEPSAQELVPSIEQKSMSSKLKILLVEDDDVSMNYLEIITKKLCEEIYKANSGTEAVELFRKNQDIKVILMDLKLPLMDGLEATRQIRTFNKEVVILAQTAYSMVGDREKAIAAGCNDYITKPIEPMRLKSLLELYTQPVK
jgi:PAS domain S-box-containing protein